MKDMERGVKHKRDHTSPEIANKLFLVDNSSGLGGQLPYKMAAQVIHSLPESLMAGNSPGNKSDTEIEFKPIDLDLIKKACGKKTKLRPI